MNSPKHRIEHDTMGEVHVPVDALWGAQTQRSLQNFEIGSERMPLRLIHAFAHLKRACALVNHDLNRLDTTKKDAIIRACEEILEGRHDQQFPLSGWQSRDVLCDDLAQFACRRCHTRLGAPVVAEVMRQGGGRAWARQPVPETVDHDPK